MFDTVLLCFLTLATLPAVYELSGAHGDRLASSDQQPVASLVIKGLVSSRHATSLEWVKATNYSKVYERDLVVTGENSSVQVVFPSKEVITVAPNSLLQIEESTPDSYH